jgi:hypothetical protein
MKPHWPIWTTLICLLACATVAGAAMMPDFSIHRLESDSSGPTLLVVGGIQGDEPGGFNAASLLVTHYRIHDGNVWVVPNLNFPSIIKRTRGIHGDLNRKFADLPISDPEFGTIQRIKSLIRDPQVDLVLNLHDGSGFYRYAYIDKLHNPNRWGQSIIIDQNDLPRARFGDLKAIADAVAEDVNNHLLDDEHRYRIRNTQTPAGNLEMAKTLTYFAALNRKPAFGLEASKSFGTHLRVYYHLHLLEAFMDQMGIRFTRAFDLDLTAIEQAIKRNVKLMLCDRRVLLDMTNVRKQLNYVPVKKGAQLDYLASNPLVAMVDTEKGLRIHHGNRRLTYLHPQYFEFDTSVSDLAIRVDGRVERVPFGSRIGVKEYFHVPSQNGFRINVIGFRRPGVVDESEIRIGREDIERRFSIDRDGRVFRLEAYRDDRFSGMVLVHFQTDGDPSGAIGAPPGSGDDDCCRYAGISTSLSHPPPVNKLTTPSARPGPIVRAPSPAPGDNSGR